MSVRDRLGIGRTPRPAGARILGRVDNPDAGEHSTPYRAQRFRGWAWWSFDGPVEVVVLRNSEEIATHTADLSRPDVQEAVLSNRGIEVAERCGFNFDVLLPSGRSSHTVEIRFRASGAPERDAGTFTFELLPERMRGAYQDNWHTLSATHDDARGMVAGTVEEETFAETASATVAQLERTIGLSAEDVVLEIGCGVGRVGAELAPRCARWIGCDVSASMLAHAAERIGSDADAEFVQVSGWDLDPIPDASVDAVYCTVVFMHLDEWDRYQYVLEAKRVLRPGGRLYVDNFNLLGDGGWETFERIKAEAHPLARSPAISKSSTPQELETYLTRAGFERVEVASESFWTFAWGRKPGGGG